MDAKTEFKLLSLLEKILKELHEIKENTSGSYYELENLLRELK